MIPIWAGLLAGLLHVISGPDHLVALAPMAVHQPGRAVRTGAMWGLGHGLGVVALGTLGIFVRGSIDVQAWSAWAEGLVGIVLIVVGGWALRSAFKVVVHVHEHEHMPVAPVAAHDHDHDHDHLHVHVGKMPHDVPQAHSRHGHAAFGVGMLHGAAGVGHLFGVIPSMALPPASAALYLGAYLVAAVASMAGFGLVLGRLSHRASARTMRGVLGACGVASVVLGVVWVGLAV